MANVLMLVVATFTLVAPSAYGHVTVSDPASGHKMAIVGESAHLHCEDADGGEVEWVFMGPFGEMIIEDSPPFVLTAIEERGGYRLYMSIEDVATEDSGEYTCRSVRNPADHQTVTLTVKTADAAPPAGWIPPKIDRREGQTTIEVEVGKELRLRCEGGLKDSTLEFRHNGDVIQTDTHNLMTKAEDVGQGRATVILSREPAITDYSGTYSCHDVTYPDPSDSVEVDVIEHPSTRVEIIEPAGRQTKVMAGEDFSIKCQSSDQTTIVWYHDDEQIEDELRGFLIAVSDDRQTHTRTSVLTKEGARDGDAGRYRCVNADSPQDDATIEVEVRAEEQSSLGGAIPVETRVVIMKVGATVNLECSFEGPGEYRPEWSKDGQLLCTGQKYSISIEHKSTSLIIKYTERYDAGIYKCEFKHVNTGYVAGILIFNVTALRCPDLKPPEHGRFDSCPRRPLHGDSCSFRCDPDYKLTNAKPLVCEQRDDVTFWAGSVPRCKLIPRDEIEANMPTSTSHVLLQIGWDLELRCLHPATWSKNGRKLQHGDKYHIRNGHLVIRNPNKLDAGYYDCYVRDATDDKLIGIQKFNVTTLACPPLSPPRNGSVVQCSRRPVYGETCIFRCNPGLRLIGNRARTCVLSHSNTQVYWTGGEPRCIGPYSSKLKYTSGARTTYNVSLSQFISLLLLLPAFH